MPIFVSIFLPPVHGHPRVPWPNEMSTRDNQSYAVTSTRAGEAERLFSKAIRDTEADRKAEAKRWVRDFIFIFFSFIFFFFF